MSHTLAGGTVYSRRIPLTKLLSWACAQPGRIPSGSSCRSAKAASTLPSGAPGCSVKCSLPRHSKP